MEKQPLIWQVDSETFDDIIQCIDDLGKYLSWLLETKQLESFTRLHRIVVRLNSLTLAICEGKFPEMGDSIDAVNRLTDELTKELTQCKTINDIERLEKQFDEKCRQIEEIRDRATGLKRKGEKPH